LDYHNLSIFFRDYFFASPGQPFIKREIIGLHLEKEKLHYICLRRTREGWKPARPSPDLEPSGSVQEPAPWSLKQFLEWLSVLPLTEGFSSGARRSIYLSLPRDQFYVRDLQLPPMNLEDALISVQNSLAVNCHLPLEEIYYDIHLCRTIQENINALIVYAPRKNMDVYLDIFRDTDHQDSLKGLFPASFGIGAWLDIQGYPMPIGLIFPQDSTYELAVYERKGCLYSGTWPLSEEEKGKELMTAAVKAKFQGLEDNIFFLNNNGTPALPLPSPNRIEMLPSLEENPGIAAIAPALSGHQEISVDGTPPRLKTFQTIRLVVPLILFLLFMVCLATLKLSWDIGRYDRRFRGLENEIAKLEKELNPLEQNRKTLKETSRFLEDINAFMETKPRLFTHLNEVARSLPENTWFSHFDFKNGSMTLKGESPDALKVIEALRSSSMFEQVNLKGSVNRDKTGVERFTLAIKLKGDDADK